MPNTTLLDNRTNIVDGKITWKNLQEIIKDMEEDQLNSLVHVFDKSGNFFADCPNGSISGYIPVINIGLAVETGKVFMFVDSYVESTE